MSIKVSKDIKATQEEIAYANQRMGQNVTYEISFHFFLDRMRAGAIMIASLNDDTSVIFHPVRVRLK